MYQKPFSKNSACTKGHLTKGLASMFKKYGNYINAVLVVAALSVSLVNLFSDRIKRHHTIGMENTISPLLREITKQACYPEGHTAAMSASLIYKREERKSCISDVGNVLYARCYTYEWKGDALFYSPTKDIMLGNDAYSCIDEDEVNIPYYDERIAKAEIGKPYLVADRSKN